MARDYTEVRLKIAELRGLCRSGSQMNSRDALPIVMLAEKLLDRVEELEAGRAS